MSLAPIVLFVYNRPEHTLKTLESLLLNDLASNSELYIFADGAKKNASTDDLKNIQATRKILEQKKWCGKVHIITSETNKGLAQSIVNGVTEIVETHQKVIVLEDDLVLSKGFLKFMNQALNMYAQSPQVMHISGYVLPIDTRHISQSTFFYSQTSCWGWATWARAWQYLNTDAQQLADKIREIPEGISKFNIDDTHEFFQPILDNVSGKLSTWAIKWHASVFLQNGLCLHPTKSLVNNIGNDGTGEHKGFTKKFLHKNITEYIDLQPIAIQENKEVTEIIKAFYRSKVPQNSILPLALRKKIAALLPQKFKNFLVKFWY